MNFYRLTIALGGGFVGSKPKLGGRFCSLMYLVRNTFLPLRSVARTWRDNMIFRIRKPWAHFNNDECKASLVARVWTGLNINVVWQSLSTKQTLNSRFGNFFFNSSSQIYALWINLSSSDDSNWQKEKSTFSSKLVCPRYIRVFPAEILHMSVGT